MLSSSFYIYFIMFLTNVSKQMIWNSNGNSNKYFSGSVSWYWIVNLAICWLGNLLISAIKKWRYRAINNVYKQRLFLDNYENESITIQHDVIKKLISSCTVHAKKCTTVRDSTNDSSFFGCGDTSSPSGNLSVESELLTS